MELTVKSYLEGVKENKFTAKEVVLTYQKQAKLMNETLNAAVRFNDNYVVEHFEDYSTKELAALPIMVKDNILVEWELATCSSKMLENYVAPYTATCMEKLQNAWALMIWQTNMDEFAMWGSTETSYYWKTINPHWKNRIPWGSSWGSAVSVASWMAIAALGTDTWGSVRQPASMCWVCWFKPTYGAISRYWVVAMASSLDQVWIFAKTVEDIKILFPYIVWFDAKDSTSSKKADELKNCNVEKKDVYKILVPEEFIWEGLDSQIRELFLKKIDELRWKWYVVDIKSLPIMKDALAIYYTLMPAEVSTNLSRFDWLRFGHQDDTQKYSSLDDYYASIRSEGFWEEAKRRILLWTFVLSSANYEWYYLKALDAQKQLRADLEKVYEEYDAILSPTSPEVAWKIWEKSSDPLKMYLSDLYTVPANLAWLPAISIPLWMVEKDWESLPIWIQLMGGKWSDWNILNLADII